MKTRSKIGHDLTVYFLVSTTGYKTIIGFSKGFDEGFAFVGNAGRDDITNLRAMHSFIKRRNQFGSTIEDSEGNTLSREELLDFAAYSRDRAVSNKYGDVVVDGHGFKFAFPSDEIKKDFYRTLSRSRGY